MTSNNMKLQLPIKSNDLYTIKGLLEPSYPNQNIPFSILSSSKLPIRKGLNQNQRCHSTSDISVIRTKSSVLFNSQIKMSARLISGVYQTNFFNRIKNMVSKQSEVSSKQSIDDFDSESVEQINGRTYCNYQLHSRLNIKKRKSKKSNQLMKNLLRECHRIRKSLNIKNNDVYQISENAQNEIVNSSLVTTPMPNWKNECRFSLNGTEEDEEDTLYGIGDSTESMTERQSLTSVSLCVTSSVDTNTQCQLCPEIYEILSTTNSSQRLRSYQVKPACISVFEKYFPKLHILYTNSNSFMPSLYQNIERKMVVPLMSNFVELKPIGSINGQTNNSNSTDNCVNTHKYFRHAQQLISNNSSQMQSIVYGPNNNQPPISKQSTIKPYHRGNVAEGREDISFLQEKLNSTMINEEPIFNNSLPFDRVIEKNMGKDETSMIMNHTDDRKTCPLGSAMSEFRERKQRKKIESQANDYKNMSSNFRQLKTECESYEKGNRKVMNSPEIVKNVQRTDNNTTCHLPPRSSEGKCPLMNEDDESSDYSELTNNIKIEKITGKNRSENISNSTNKKVCFNIDVKKSEQMTYDQPTTSYQNQIDYDKTTYLDQQIQGINMMLNNVIRRMNNLELHFQEFSTLFINLHKESLYTQKNMTVANQCFDFAQLDCNQERFSSS